MKQQKNHSHKHGPLKTAPVQLNPYMFIWPNEMPLKMPRELPDVIADTVYHF